MEEEKLSDEQKRELFLTELEKYIINKIEAGKEYTYFSLAKLTDGSVPTCKSAMQKAHALDIVTCGIKKLSKFGYKFVWKLKLKEEK